MNTASRVLGAGQPLHVVVGLVSTSPERWMTT